MALAASADGTLSTTPDLSRLMLLLMKASGLDWYSEASIWSSDTPECLVLLAMRDSESPGLTLYSSGPVASADGATGALAVERRGSVGVPSTAGARGVLGRAARGAGAGADASAGAGVITGEVVGLAGGTGAAAMRV